jgi:23S rRNA (pseudouridine1915-N3)-methyltransferase
VLRTRVIAVGRARGVERELVQRYAGRIRPEPILVEVADGVGSPAEIRRREGAALLGALPEAAFLIALDAGGRALTSEAFAGALASLRDAGRHVAFAIGGAEGLDSAVLDRAETVLSFGPQIWPHLLARVMLMEQLYRAQAIEAGHPYHRGR